MVVKLVTSLIGRINEVAVRRAGLVLKRVTVRGDIPFGYLSKPSTSGHPSMCMGWVISTGNG